MQVPPFRVALSPPLPPPSLVSWPSPPDYVQQSAPINTIFFLNKTKVRNQGFFMDEKQKYVHEKHDTLSIKVLNVF